MTEDIKMTLMLSEVQQNRLVRRIMFVYLDPVLAGYACLRGKVNPHIRKRPQLGFQYLVSVLEKIGVDSVIMDQTITPFTVDQLKERIEEEGIDIVGFYSATTIKNKVKPFIAELKKKIKIPIIIGGPGSINGKEYLELGCDIVCNGEGERTLLEIMDYYNGRKKISDIKGISYIESARLVTNPPQDLIEDLNSIPFPHRGKIPLKYYHDYYIFTMKKPYVTMITSRGCPMSCTFCTSHLIWKKKYRVRSVDNVLKEIDYLKNALNVKYIAFLDDIFGLNESWLKEFCAGLIDRKYNIRWMCILHPFSLRNSRDELLNLLRTAGCDTLSFGLQSAHPEILKNIKRYPSEPEELEKTIGLAKKRGFLTSVGVIFGLPGETRDTIKFTIDYCCRLRPTYAEFYNLDILEGSEIEMAYKTKENVCDMHKEELDYWCRFAARKFYLDVSQLITMIKIVITKNPFWLLVFLKRMKYFVSNTGI